MFIKKRKELPKAPEGADGGAYGLFKERNPNQPRNIAAEDVIDVEAVVTKTPVSVEVEKELDEVKTSSGIKIRKKAPTTSQSELPQASGDSIEPEPFSKEQRRKSRFSFSVGRKSKDVSPDSESVTRSFSTKERKQQSQSSSSLDLVIKMEDGESVFWRLTEDDIQEVGQGDVTSSASFSTDEIRMRAERIKTHSAAMELALSEIGEDARIVFRPKTGQVIYATPASRIMDLAPTRVGPGAMLVDALLKDDWTDNSDFVCCLVLKTAEGTNGLVILYHGNSAGDLSKPQVSINSQNLNFVISQFANALKLNLDTTKVVMLGNKELLSVGQALEEYPAEGSWRGISVSRMWNSAASAGMACALGALLFAGYAYYELQNNESEKSLLAANLNTEKSKASEILTTSMLSFSKAQSIDMHRITERAGMAWSPGAKVALEATISREKYVTSLPLLAKGAEVGGPPTVLNQKSIDFVEPILKMEPPAGCLKAAPEISGGLNVVQITINCENTDTTFPSYILD